MISCRQPRTGAWSWEIRAWRCRRSAAPRCCRPTSWLLGGKPRGQTSSKLGTWNRSFRACKRRIIHDIIHLYLYYYIILLYYIIILYYYIILLCILFARICRTTESQKAEDPVSWMSMPHMQRTANCQQDLPRLWQILELVKQGHVGLRCEDELGSPGAVALCSTVGSPRELLPRD